LLKTYKSPDLPAEQLAELKKMVTKLASEAGMEKLPALEYDYLLVCHSP
jgi:hypothetical protein